METSNRAQQVGWLREIAGEIANEYRDWTGETPETAVRWWESNQMHEDMPEWYDDHDRNLLAQMVTQIMAL